MVWDLRTGKGIYEVMQGDSLLCSRFHPNGFELAVAGKANLISIFDLRRKKELKHIPAHLKLISDLKFDEGGNFLASVSHDNTVRLWHGQNYGPLPVEIVEQHKLTSIDINLGRLAVTCIDRKWSMFVNNHKWKAEEMIK